MELPGTKGPTEVQSRLSGAGGPVGEKAANSQNQEADDPEDEVGLPPSIKGDEGGCRGCPGKRADADAGYRDADGEPCRRSNQEPAAATIGT